MPDTQHYYAKVNLDIGEDELATIYHDMCGPVGMSASEVRAVAYEAALEEVPGGKVVGSRVHTDGKLC